MPFRLVLLALLIFPLTALAQAPKVEVVAAIAPAQARPNQQVALNITVTGGAPDAMPNLRLPLQIQQVSAVSTSQQFSMVNGVTSTKITFSWALVGTEPGDFVIPPQEISVGGQTYQTNEVQFKVTQGQTGENPSANTGNRNPEDAFLQLEIGKTEIYQGELVPLSASLYVPTRMGLRRFGLIDINKDDFAIQRFPQQAEQSQTVVGNLGYNVFTFRTTLSAIRTGDLKIGPANQELLVEVVNQDSFGRTPFGFPFAEPQKLIATSQQIPVKVVPLPDEGKPASFSGAVGDFTLNATATPTEGLKVGDPIAIELILEGSGNFDAIAEPKLSDATDWKTYPSRRYNVEGQIDPVLMPTVERQVGYSTVIVPQKAHPMIPSFEITYFSPNQKKYVVLQTPPIPVKIEAPAPVTSGPDGGPADATDLAAVGPPPAVAPRAEVTDILSDLPATAEWIAPPAEPLYKQPLFWAVQSAPVLLLALALIGRLTSGRRARLAAGPSGAIRQAWSQLNASGLSDHEFLRRASQFVLTSADAASHDRPEFASILKRYADHNFVGPTGPAEPLTQRERSDILRHLSTLKTEALNRATQLASSPALVATALLLTLLPSPLIAQTTATKKDPAQTYTTALAAFESGKFKEAQYHAESLVKDPATASLSPQLFELIGHARYRADDLGRAALWYRRAEFFTPRDPELRQNLRHLDDRVRFLSFQPQSPLHAWSLKLSQTEWLLIAAGGFWLLLLPLAWVVLSRKRQALPLFASALGGLVLIAALILLFIRPSPQERVQDIAVVTAKDIRAHTAAATTAGSVIDLPPGSTTRILEVRGAWSYCEIPYQPDPLRGWVENSALTPLWPFDARLIP
jgi:hypothetical protein